MFKQCPKHEQKQISIKKEKTKRVGSKCQSNKDYSQKLGNPSRLFRRQLQFTLRLPKVPIRPAKNSHKNINNASHLFLNRIKEMGHENYQLTVLKSVKHLQVTTALEAVEVGYMFPEPVDAGQG